MALTTAEQATCLAEARAAMRREAAAIARAAERLDEGLCKALDVILSHPGKIVVTGVGKSGQIGQKLTATLCSIGLPAVFLHAADAVHGDLGVIAHGDPCILITKSGTTAEVTRLLPRLKELGCPLIGIIGNRTSTLSKRVDVLLDGTVSGEARADSPVPTSSTVVAMALGDALAVALMQARGFSADDFSRNHPGGQLGRNLRLFVRQAMRPLDQVARAGGEDSLKAVVVAMTHYPSGAACVLDEDGRLTGLITDGDLRRALEAHDDIRGLRAADVMTRQPVVIGPEAKLQDALSLMEERTSQISVLPVVDAVTGQCVGLLRLHDIYQVSHV